MMTVKQLNTIKLPFALKAVRNFQFPHKHGILRRIYDGVLAKNGVAWVETSAGLDWKLDLNISNHRSLVYGDYEGNGQVRWMKRWLSEGGIIVDSGANIGQTLIYFLQSPQTKVLCIEPVPECVAWLNECINAGDFNDRVTVINALFDESEGKTELKVAGEGDTGEWSTVHTDWFERLQTKTISCEAITLDALLDERNVSSVRFWKLDVEGAELRALLGARQSLSRQMIDALLVEIIPENSEPVNELMNSYGYVAYQITNKGELERLSTANHCSDLVGNCLYLPLEEPVN